MFMDITPLCGHPKFRNRKLYYLRKTVDMPLPGM
jgi:hypothetical protein